MGKKIQIDLTFKADTSAAKQQMQELQQQLSNIATARMEPVHLNTMRKSLTEAKMKALELKSALNEATNVNTGRLDFGKFSQQLAKNKMSIKDYAKALGKLGPEGQQAFASLTQAIANSEAPVLRLKGKVAALGKTLANTAKWQISSSFLQGVTSAISGTIDYAKELNESLNNIRIVTGKNEEAMSKFAVKANKAAKQLSTATTEYTNASLIYFQQGLNDSEVAERTATTIKLANAVGKNAEEVSEWMTAIWNNFDDGSQSLEHYGDVLAKLGAATASSADEIAGGLEKFSAVADSVGLSYEYAASALATITAETRQSEDVVGTALKTIFARVENLKLGEKLEDGTTLGQYSAALEKVGVSIKDTKGGLKDMDDILDEIGARWNGLARDEQVALAQSVAGVRQYNQFIAMMDNYDTMKENVELAKESANTLELQNEIYSQGMEGTTKRVQANMEEIKNTLLDENDLIPLLNIADGFLTVIGDLVKSFGGLPGILSLVGSIGLKIWGPQVTKSIQGAIDGMKNFWYVASGKAQTDRLDMLHESAKATKKMVEKGHYGDNEGALINKYLDEQVARKEKLWGIESRLTEEQQEALNLAEQMVKAKEDEAIAVAKTVDEYKKAADAARDLMEHSGQFEGTNGIEKLKKGEYETGEEVKTDLVKLDYTYNNKKDKMTDEERAQFEAKREKVAGAETEYETNKTAYEKAEAKYQKALGKQDTEDALTPEELEQLKKEKALAQGRMTRSKNKLISVSQDLANAAGEMEPMNEEAGDVDELERAARYKSDVAQLAGEHRYDTANALEKDVNKVDEMVMKYEKDEQGNNTIPVELMDKYKKEKSLLQDSMDKFNDADAAAKDAGEERKKAEEEAEKNPKDKDKAKAAEEAKKKEKEAIKVRDQAQKQMREQAKSYATTAKQIDIATKAVEKNTKHIDKNTKEGQDQIKNAEDYVKALEDEIAAKKEKERIDKEVAAEQEAMNQKLDDAAHGQRNMVSAFVNLGQGAMSAVSAYQMVSGAIDNLSTSIVDGEFSLSTLLSTFMSIGMAVPQVVNTFTGMGKALDALGISFGKANKAQDEQNKKTSIGTAIKKLFTKATKKEGQESDKTTKKKVANTGKETAADSTGAMAALAKMIAQNWVLGLAIAVPVLALLAVGVAMSVSAKSDEKSKERARAEAAARVEELKEEVEKNGEVYTSYKEALAVYEETGQGKEKLAEIALQITEAYGIEGAAVAALSGDYDKLTESIDAARVAELKQLADAAKQSIALDNETFEDAMRDGKGKADGNGGYIAEFNDGGSGGSQSQGENAAINAAVQEFKKEHADDPELNSIFGTGGEGDITLNLPTRSSEDFAKGYEAVMQVTSRAREIGDVSTSQIYDEMMSWLAKSQEEYEKYNENNKIVIESEAEAAVLETKSASGKTVSNINRNDMKDYLSYRKSVLGDYDKDSEEYKARVQKLGEQENVADLEIIARVMEEQADMFADFNDTTKEWLETQYANASDARRRAMAMVKGEELTMEEFNEQVAANMLSGSVAARISNATSKEVGYKEQQSNAIFRVLKTYNKELAKNETVLNIIADNYTVLNSRADKLSKAWQTHATTILTANKNSVQYGAAIGALAKDMKDFFAITDENVDLTNFVHMNSELINQLMTGDLEAFEQLQNEIGKELVNTTYSSVEGLDGLIREIGDVSNYAEGSTKQLSGAMAELWNSDGMEQQAMRETAEAMGFLIEEIDGVVQITRTKDANGLAEWAKKAEEQINKLVKAIDRFSYIKEKIADNNDLSDITKEFRDNTFGKTQDDLSAAYQNQLEEEYQLLEEYYDKAKEIYGEDREILLKNWDVELDDKGRIMNRAEIEKSLVNDSETLNKFKEQADNYTKSLNTFEEQHYAKIRKRNEQLSEQIQDINRKLEFKVRVNDAQLALLDFQLQHIEDDAFAAAEAISFLGQKSNAELQSFQAYQKSFRDTLKLTFSDKEIEGLMKGDVSVIDGQFMTEEQLAQLEDYKEAMFELEESMRSTRIEMQEKLNDAMGAYNEKLDQGMAKLENYTSTLEHYKNIISIVGKDSLGISDEITKGLRDAQIDNSQNSLMAAKTAMEANKQVLDAAEAELLKARKEGNELAIQQWEETVEQAQDQYQSSMEGFQDAWATSLETIAEAFAEHMEEVANSFSEATGGIYGSLENMRKAFDRQMQVSEYYLQNFEKTYEISKLNRKITDNLDKTDNLVTQSRLVDLQQDLLKMNQEGVKVSQRDIEYMQKKYDLIIAEEALKEAQNAKSLVRLKRDSEGNFGYMYTSDQEATTKAQQGYEDALYALQKFSDDTDKELAEMLLATNEQAYAAIQELGDMATWTQEEWATNMANLSSQYGEDIEYILSEYQKLLDKNKKSNTQYYADLVETFNQTYMAGIYPDYESFVSLQGDLTVTLGNHCTTANDAFTEMKDNVDESMELAGTSVDDFGKKVTETKNKIVTDSNTATKSVETMATKMVNKITGPNGIVDSISKWDKTWGTVYKNITTQATKVATAIDTIYKAYGKLSGLDIGSLGLNDGNGSDTGQNGLGEKAQDLATEKTQGWVSQKMTGKDGRAYYKVTYTGADGKNVQTKWLTANQLYNSKGTGVVNEKDIKIGRTKSQSTQVSVDVSQGLTEKQITTNAGYKKIEEVEAMMKGKTSKGNELSTGHINLVKTSDDEYYAVKVPKGQKDKAVGDEIDVNDSANVRKLTADEYNQLVTYGQVPKAEMVTGGKGSVRTGLIASDNTSYSYTSDKMKNSYYPNLDILGYSLIGGKIYAYVQDQGGKNAGFKHGASDKGYKVGDPSSRTFIPIKYLDYNNDKSVDMEFFDTGGYTGDWGPEGRIAMLHQKEIVLNAHDTENFLAAIGIVRDISDQIERNAIAMQYANSLSNYKTNIAGLHETIQQDVHITAEFPNATNHSEIEEAFRNLTNYASQYVFRR